MGFPVAFARMLAIITLVTAPAYSQSISASENPLTVGSNVTFTSQSPVTVGVWLFETTLIVLIFPGGFTISDSYSSRATFNSATSSLTITSLRQDDSGVYTLQSVNSAPATLMLSVQVPISGVSLMANATNLVEFNSTALLTCSVTNGSSLSYVWWSGNSTVTPGERLVFGDGGATLTIHRVTRDEEGPYRCNVSNGVSHEMSSTVKLNISYGPDTPVMLIMPMGHTFKTGSNITLSCSAVSSPPAVISWWMNGANMNHNGPQVHLQGVTVNNSGSYTCLFHNPVTLRYTSAGTNITIVAPIAGVMVNHSGGLAIVNESLTLHCYVSGPAYSITWWRNGNQIHQDNTTMISMNGKKLTLNPVQRTDDGDYQCMASNPVSNMTSSPYTVVVYYGPMKPVISGPSMALMGTSAMFNCSSASRPPSHIRWYFKDYLLSNSSKLTLHNVTLNMTGKYVCKAFNNVTGKNSSSYMMFTVLAPVAKAMIKSAGPQPIEGHNFSLTCETEGSVHSIVWYRNGIKLHPHNTSNLSVENATLSFQPVHQNDSGHYQCMASNPLSNRTSGVFMLRPYYGPMKPTIMGPNMAITGDNITLSCHAPSNPPSSYKWLFNGSVVSNTSEYVTPPLSMDMSGMYTCVAYNNVTGKNSTAYTMLTVKDSIKHVYVDKPMNPPIEGHVYMLTCNVTGPAHHVYWMKNGELLHDDNHTHIYMNATKLKFDPIKRNDTGEYQCMASYDGTNMTSPPCSVYVNFGPDKPIIYGPAYGEKGRSVTFNCSAMSMPHSRYSWWFNGTWLANTSMLTISHLSYNMSGEYTCKAYNNVTGMNSTSSKMLTVIEGIKSVMIKNDTVPIATKNFTLTCEIVGPYDSMYWMKDNKKLSMNSWGNMSYHIQNHTLHFTPLTRYSDGEYKCVATNRAGSHQSPPYKLLVNYGPLSVSITGPNIALVGFTVTMTCYASSQPESHFYWFFNNESSVLKTGPQLTFIVKRESEGDYKCMATNPVTNITMYATKAFTADATALHIPSRAALMVMGLFALSVHVLFN